MHDYSSLVVLGDDLYADIVTSYLAVQLKPYNIRIHRVLGSSQPADTLIKVDHSIHALNQELGLEFDQLMQEQILVPELVSEYQFGNTTCFLESFPHLKDDLPVPGYQLMVRLLKEGIVTKLGSESPLIALHQAKKFHPQLHRLYSGDLRPYGASIQVSAYSKILREVSATFFVNVIESKNLEVELADESIVSVSFQDGSSIQNAFFIDMSDQQILMTPLVRGCADNTEQNFWLANCLSLSQLTNVIVKPANIFEWLFKALARFADFFPDINRQKTLASEYNRLQKQDLQAVTNFLMLFKWLKMDQEKNNLPEALQHSLGLFVDSCQLSQDEIMAYPDCWPTMMISAGLIPERVPRRVAEIPLTYLKNWYDQRQQNIKFLLQSAQ